MAALETMTFDTRDLVHCTCSWALDSTVRADDMIVILETRRQIVGEYAISK